MWLLWIFLAIAVCIILLVLVDVIYPESKAVKSAKDWQGLIGALLGFLVLGVSISLSGIVQSEKEKQDELSSELAYLEMVETEQKEFQRLINRRLSAIGNELETNLAIRCNTVAKALDEFKVRSSLLETQLPNLVPDLHPESVRAITLANSGQQNYSDALGTIMPTGRGCPSRAEEKLNELEKFHQESLSDVGDVLARLAAQKTIVRDQITD